MALLAPPLMLGLIAKTKASMAGREGPPLLQPFHDLLKLLRKGAVYSTTTTWVFRLGPVASLAATMTAALLVPFGTHAPVAFN
ncbi:MAG: NADH-quinone oxidoreductase subunit H, partial [Elusimicrobia bacterium]|nr:NADH-quinone oxidoreductase subunit H [Elusimicrobiota bacterium]